MTLGTVLPAVLPCMGLHDARAGPSAQVGRCGCGPAGGGRAWRPAARLRDGPAVAPRHAAHAGCQQRGPAVADGPAATELREAAERSRRGFDGRGAGRGLWRRQGRVRVRNSRRRAAGAGWVTVCSGTCEKGREGGGVWQGRARGRVLKAVPYLPVPPPPASSSSSSRRLLSFCACERAVPRLTSTAWVKSPCGGAACARFCRFVVVLCRGVLLSRRWRAGQPRAPLPARFRAVCGNKGAARSALCTLWCVHVCLFDAWHVVCIAAESERQAAIREAARAVASGAHSFAGPPCGTGHRGMHCGSHVVMMMMCYKPRLVDMWCAAVADERSGGRRRSP